LTDGDRTARGQPVISARGLIVGFGDALVLKGVDLDVLRGEVIGLVGPSGGGKSVLTRTILGLNRKRAGSIIIFGKDVDTLERPERERLERRWGVLFQQGALFSGLTVRQNIEAPLREHVGLPFDSRKDVALMKLDLVGLPRSAAEKLPSELSGGMVKRAALARALALDPEVIFLDEPTSGLDPISAGEFDDLIGTLQKTLGVTVFMVTHDLDSLYSICDRVAALAGGRIIATGPVEQLRASDDPWLVQYFRGKRGRIRAAASAPRPPRAQ
jgi:phospholipid/cholesterol/gamma-HCH transport system ATP-binding protein